MPWSVAPLRAGRAWPLAPDAASLRARWDALVRCESAEERAALFQPSRIRGLHTAVPQLPGHDAPTAPLAAERGPCPEPVRVLHGPFDQQWLIPDHRLIDAARPELWRVAGPGQTFVVEQARGPVPAARAAEGRAPLRDPDPAGPAVVCSALLPDGHAPAGRPGRIRPLFRRPGGREPNLAPGLLDRLTDLLGRAVSAEDFLAWTTAAAAHGAGGCAVPLPLSPAVWDTGVALGRRMLWLYTHGARCGRSPEDRPKLPGGRRPYVRAALPSNLRALSGALRYDADEETLHLGEGRIAPVPAGAWEFRAAGVRVLEHWVDLRSAPAPAGPLDAIRPALWPREWTSDLLELITVLALLAELRPQQRELAARLSEGQQLTADELRTAGVLPAPAAARHPASVLDHHEEGPNGQFALL
ncbi:type ISP restriction/modification enzyme [Streptomyces sp. NPDC002055]|uniref:type ISP restriction/modification enzyme n=1 Tax=Streptomyces sp. NPDC002055 TaxID=3154534 RepID=UPI00331D6B21